VRRYLAAPAVRSVDLPGRTFGLEPHHFEQVAQRLQSGTAGHGRKVRRKRRHITGYRRGLTGYSILIGHLRSVPGNGPAKSIGVVSPMDENTQSDSISNLFNGLLYFPYPLAYNQGA